MVSKSKHIILAPFAIFLLLGCASVKTKLPMDQSSVEPGSSVTFRGEPLKLIGTPLSIGKPLPSAKLVDAMTMKEVDLSQERGSVLFLSIVVSVDTPVCEEQTHYLADEGRNCPRRSNASPSVGIHPSPRSVRQRVKSNGNFLLIGL